MKKSWIKNAIVILLCAASCITIFNAIPKSEDKETEKDTSTETAAVAVVDMEI